MNILSINFGHDASLTLMRDGKAVSFAELERHCRIKHVLGVDADQIHNFLASCGLSFSDVDVAGLCATQLWGGAYQGFDVAHGLPSSVPSFLSPNPVWKADRAVYGGDDLRPPWSDHLARFDNPKWVKFPDDIGTNNPHYTGLPNGTAEQNRLMQVCAAWLGETGKNEDQLRASRVGSYLHPYSLTLGGITKPAFFVPHHYSHAWYASYHAPDRAIICSHDGGIPGLPFNTGGIYLVDEREVMPVCSHGLGLGCLYDEAALRAGFSIAEGAGKLMGLASYGIPSAGVARLVARQLERLDGTVRESMESLWRLMNELHFLAQTDQVLRTRSLSNFAFELPNRDVAVALAANTQSFVERVFAEGIGRTVGILADRMDTGRDVMLVGGFALNCPSNSLLQTTCGGLRVRPLPGATDAGISLGAACAIHYYFSGKRPRETDRMEAAFPKRITTPSGWTPGLPELRDCDAAWMARELVAGNIFCVFQGDSEIGPRALGHRSIVAHAVTAQVRDLINQRKGRESWRPLAPMCRPQDFQRYFHGSPLLAEHMLFTFPVMDRNLHAVTHVDGTARVQVADRESCGILFDVLTRLDEMGAAPVIVNTSFNVAGEPIVETEAEAGKSFVKLGFDYLYVNGRFFKPRG